MREEWEGEKLWGDIDGKSTSNKLFKLYSSNEIDLLKNVILQLIQLQPAIPILLIGTLWNDEGVTEDFTHWLIQQKELFPKSQDHLDLGLRTSMFKWRPDGVELFTELGAEPNQEVLAGRTLFDLAVARNDFGYQCPEEGELERTIEALSSVGGKHYLELKYKEKIACKSIFSYLPLHDSWAEVVITEMSKLNLPTQELYSKLFSACINKAKNPSKKWWDSTMLIIDEIGQPVFLGYLASWLLEACKPRKSHVYGYTGSGNVHRYSYMAENPDAEIWKVSEKSATLLKSLLWLTKLINNKDRTALLHGFSTSMFTTYRNTGIRNPALASQSYGLMIQVPEGRQRGLEMLEQCDHKPSVKRMNGAFEKLHKK